MSALTRDDLTVIEGDARVSCRSLQKALGFARIDHLHRLIRAHQDELRDFGEVFLFEGGNPVGGVFRFEGGNPSERGGRPIKTYLLNEHQAVALAMWAETAEARAARRQIAEVFVAWRRGDAYRLEQMRQAPDPFAAQAERVGHVVDHLRLLPEAQRDALNLTHLPIWTNGRRPPWWHNVALRSFLAQAHRQMTMSDCLDEAGRRFGARDLPSMSGLHRFWSKLDRVFGPSVLTLPSPSKPQRKAS